METIVDEELTRKVIERDTTAEADVQKRSIFSLRDQELQFENARFGWMAILLTFQSCLGAVACLFISENASNTFVLSLCAAITMGSNALFIALASARQCLVGFYASVLINAAIVIYYI